MLIMDAAPCTDLWSIWQLLGWVLTIFKIVIPILIIVFGMIDLGKAVIASKDDEIKKSIKSLAMRLIAGIVIFFIPTLVGAVFKVVGSFSDLQDEYSVCSVCITSPGNCSSEAEKHCKASKESGGLGGTWNSDNTCSVPNN